MNESIAGVVPQSPQIQAQVTLTNLGWSD